jgi:hypothetical protein
MTMTDLSTVVLSKTVVSFGGTLGRMSPELLDPQRFGSNGCPTRESDCYALGMVTYEVSWIRSRSRWSSTHPSSGSDWSPPIPSHNRNHTCARYNERRPSKETS